MEGIEAVEVEHRPCRLERVQPSANFGVRKKSRCNHGPIAALTTPSRSDEPRGIPSRDLVGGRCPSKHWGLRRKSFSGCVDLVVRVSALSDDLPQNSRTGKPAPTLVFVLAGH